MVRCALIIIRARSLLIVKGILENEALTIPNIDIVSTWLGPDGCVSASTKKEGENLRCALRKDSSAYLRTYLLKFLLNEVHSSFYP